MVVDDNGNNNTDESREDQLKKMRSMWQFAASVQFMLTFLKVLKIETFDTSVI
jgi:hypothetical protein